MKNIRVILISIGCIGIIVIMSGILTLHAETTNQEKLVNTLEKQVVIKAPRPTYKIIKDVAIAPIEKGFSGKVVLLTIDDGPSPYTKQIADTLQKRGVKAIFFINGMNDKQNQGAITYLSQKGFPVGNHTWSHRNLKKETNWETIEKEINTTTDLITKQTGSSPKFFRPPYGEGSQALKEKIRSDNMLYIGWSSSSKDWEPSSVKKEQFLSNIKNSLRVGSIILIHEHEWSIPYLDDMITMIEEEGYSFADPDAIVFTNEQNNNQNTTPKKVEKKPSCPKPKNEFKDESLRNVGQDIGLENQNYMPSDLAFIPGKYASSSSLCLRKEALDNLTKLLEDAKKDGHILKVTSAFRDPAYQQKIIDLHIKNKNPDTDKAVAKAGHSEHQLGTTIDITGATISYTSTATKFKDSPEYKWLMENADAYGFVESYPSGKEEITGYMYEPWHYRYVGIEHAQKIKKEGTTITEYLSTLAK